MAFSKLLIVGLDSAAPTLVFDRWRDELPTLAGLIARGAHGRMLSTHPPITVPAWTKSEYTYPPALKLEVERVTEGYVLDVEDFRTADKAGLLRRVYAKTDKHLRLAKHLLRTRSWDFFMLVEMGVDRIHHAFWSHMDPAHHKYEAGNPFEHAIRDYYRHVDAEPAAIRSLR